MYFPGRFGTWDALCADVAGRRWAEVDGEEHAEMQVLVKTLTGKTVTLDVAVGATVVATKVALEEKTGVPVDMQRLLFAGKQLADNQLLSSYGFRKGSTLHLVLRLRGGVQTLPELADAVAVAERRELPGGKCLVCSYRGKRDRWCDEGHFGTTTHRRAVGWAQQQLDDGCLDRVSCAPCGQEASSASWSTSSGEASAPATSSD